MDTRTGKIYEAESAEALARKLGAEPGDVVMLDRLPDATCKRCGGTGSRRPMFSRRYVPCRCTKEFWGRK